MRYQLYRLQQFAKFESRGVWRIKPGQSWSPPAREPLDDNHNNISIFPTFHPTNPFQCNKYMGSFIFHKTPTHSHARLIPICTTLPSPPLPPHATCQSPSSSHMSHPRRHDGQLKAATPRHQNKTPAFPRRPIQGPERADFSFGPPCQQTAKRGIRGGRLHEEKNDTSALMLLLPLIISPYA